MTGHRLDGQNRNHGYSSNIHQVFRIFGHSFQLKGWGLFLLEEALFPSYLVERTSLKFIQKVAFTSVLQYKYQCIRSNNAIRLNLDLHVVSPNNHRGFKS